MLYQLLCCQSYSSNCDGLQTGRCIHLTETTAAQNEVALSYRSVRGLYFLAAVFVRSFHSTYIIVIPKKC